MHSPQKSRSINEDQFLTPQKRVSGKTLRWPSTNKKSLNRKRTKVVIINNIDEDIAGFFARSPLFPPRDPMDLVPDPADP